MAEEKNAEQRTQDAYEQVESRVARAAERMVSRPAFGELLAMATENVVALTRIGNEALDLTLRNLRLAGRRDLIALQRQLARTEDKLERVLQEVEQLETRLAEQGGNGSPPARSRSRSRSKAKSS